MKQSLLQKTACLEQGSPPAPTVLAGVPLVSSVSTGSRAAGAGQVWDRALPCPALLWPCWGLAQGESPRHPWSPSLPPLHQPSTWLLLVIREVQNHALKVGPDVPLTDRAQAPESSEIPGICPSNGWGHSDCRSFTAPCRSLPVLSARAVWNTQ